MKEYIEQGLSAKEVSDILNISTRRVHYLANRDNLNFKHKSKYNINYKLFNEQLHNENTYYLLGYLFSDGYVNKKKGLINIPSKDKEILEKLSLIVGNVPVNKNTVGSYYIQWYSKQHIEELEKLGCTNNKSLTLKFPTLLNNNLIHHFIRGYFDGDGSIGLYSRTGKNRRLTKVLKVSIAGTFEFLDKIKEIVNFKGSIRKIKNTNIYVLNYSGNISASNFCFYIYNNFTITMNRKFENFKGFIQYRHLIDN